MQHLTYLQVDRLNADNLLQLGGLTNLLELILSAVDDGVPVGPNRLPGMVLPDSLTALYLDSPVEAALLSLAPTSLKSLSADVSATVVGPSEGPDSFLSCLARLQHLTELSLEPSNGIAWSAPGPAYSALTASSNLVQVKVAGYEFPPEFCMSYMLPTTGKLSRLEYLYLDIFWGNEDGTLGIMLWDAAGLSKLVYCCRSLSNLCCCSYGSEVLGLQPGLHVSGLTALSALTGLRVWFDTDGPDSLDECMRGLAAVTQLQELRLVESKGTRVAALLPLTGLTALTKLKLERG
jgi:hypothetical protein